MGWELIEWKIEAISAVWISHYVWPVTHFSIAGGTLFEEISVSIRVAHIRFSSYEFVFRPYHSVPLVSARAFDVVVLRARKTNWESGNCHGRWGFWQGVWSCRRNVLTWITYSVTLKIVWANMRRNMCFIFLFFLCVYASGLSIFLSQSAGIVRFWSDAIVHFKGCSFLPYKLIVFSTLWL